MHSSVQALVSVVSDFRITLAPLISTTVPLRRGYVLAGAIIFAASQVLASVEWRGWNSSRSTRGDRSEALLGVSETLVGRAHPVTSDGHGSSMRASLVHLKTFSLLIQVFKLYHDLADVRFL